MCRIKFRNYHNSESRRKLINGFCVVVVADVHVCGAGDREAHRVRDCCPTRNVETRTVEREEKFRDSTSSQNTELFFFAQRVYG